MPNHTASPHSPSQSPDQTDDWRPTSFDAYDPKCQALANAWAEKQRAYYSAISAKLLHFLVDLWAEYGHDQVYSPESIHDYFWDADSIPPAVTESAIRYLESRGLLRRSDFGEVSLPYSSYWDYVEAFDHAFPGVRTTRSQDADPETRPRAKKVGTVYLLRCHDRYKIGVTRQFEQRFSQLHNGQSPYPLEVVHHVTGPNYTKFEKELHRRHEDKRVHSEWFLLETPDDVQQVIDEMNAWQEERG